MKRALLLALSCLFATVAQAKEHDSLGKAPWLNPANPELWVASPAARQKAVTVLNPINTGSKVAVRDAYNAYFVPAMPAMGFTGSVASCQPGTIGIAYKEFTISRVNYYRALSGLPGNVTLDTDAVREVQQQSAAVLFSANQRLSHNPALEPANFPLCPSLTAPADAAAASSNLGLAFGNPALDDMIPRFMDNAGTGNEPAGHRRWILYPPQSSMTVGATPTTASAWGASVLRVFNAFTTRPATPNGVAWPPAGYVPVPNLPPSKRWSFSFPDASFSAANVSITANGSPIAVTVVSRTDDGYGDNAIVFVPSGTIVKDVAYAVTITGITAGPGSITYVVRPFDPTELIGGAPSDFNRDGRPDIIFRNAGSGTAFIWRMNGAQLLSDQSLGTTPPPWFITGTGDFNGDGKTDLLWRNATTGSIYVWYMNDGVFISDAFVATVDPVWKMEVVGDFNRDGRPDLLLRHTGNGGGYIWYLNNATLTSDQYLFQIDPAWIVEGTGDFNADGGPDLLFRNTQSGLAFVWYTAFSGGVTSLAASTPPLFSIAPQWEVVQVADWNADGQPDLLFRNRQTGVIFVWYVNGTALAGSDYITQIDPVWRIEPRP